MTQAERNWAQGYYAGEVPNPENAPEDTDEVLEDDQYDTEGYSYEDDCTMSEDGLFILDGYGEGQVMSPEDSCPF